jgi:alpha-tubulin suppressor-like RCC1 family protein
MLVTSATVLVTLASVGFSAFASAASSGTTFGWGENVDGQLGDGTKTPSSTPVALSGLGDVTAIAAGGNFGLALLSNGTVMAWGNNGIGQLGNGTTASTPTPLPVTGLSGVIAIAAGNYHGLALLSNGTVMAWGDNAEGQLGAGTFSGPEKCGVNVCSTTPVAVSGLSDVTSIAAGAGHSLAVLSSGSVMTWGQNNDGQLGDGTTARSSTPVLVTGLSGARAVAGGYEHSLALLLDGSVMAWGNSAVGQLGDGVFSGPETCEASCSTKPVAVTGLSGATAIAAGSAHSLALLSNGTVMAWGRNGFGELGDGTHTGPEACVSSFACAATPVAVSGLSGVTAIAAGEEFSFALLSNATMMAWGYNHEGELGDGTATTTGCWCMDAPVAVSGLSGVTALAAEDQAYTGLALQGILAPIAPSGTGTPSTPTSSSFGPANQTTTTSLAPSALTSSSSHTKNQAAATALALKCSDSELTLTDLVISRGRVVLTGAASSRFAGKRATIVFAGHEQVATTIVKKGGSFSATVALPPASVRNSNSARYQAEIGSVHSLSLKLTRRLTLDPPNAQDDKVVLTGTVGPPLTKPVASVLVGESTSCSGSHTIARVTPTASGTYRLTIHAPTGAQAAIYRLTTKVRGASQSRATFTTYSLPEAVGLG